MRSSIVKKFNQSFKGAIYALPWFFFLLLWQVFFLVSCNQNSNPINASLASKGRGVYLANCTACHNQNPKLQGSIGPDLYGSSLEVLTEKILRKSYPQNYKPKRQSQVMPTLINLEKDILSLHAYLNEK